MSGWSAVNASSNCDSASGASDCLQNFPGHHVETIHQRKFHATRYFCFRFTTVHAITVITTVLPLCKRIQRTSSFHNVECTHLYITHEPDCDTTTTSTDRGRRSFDDIGSALFVRRIDIGGRIRITLAHSDTVVNVVTNCRCTFGFSSFKLFLTTAHMLIPFQLGSTVTTNIDEHVIESE